MPRELALVGALADRVVDRLRRRLVLDLDGQVHQRGGRHGHADGEALQATGELGDQEADRLGGAGRGGDEVDRGAAGAAVVLVRRVEQLLVAGVGVHGGHHAVADAERLVEHLDHGRQAVRRAGGVGDDVVPGGVVDLVEVDAQRDGDVGLLGRRGDDHLARPGLEVLGGARAVAEVPARLDHDLGADVAPRERRGVRLGEHGDLAPVDPQRPVEHLDGTGEGPVDGVVAQQMREHLDVHHVVDAGPLDGGVALVSGAEGRAAGAAEAVDANPDGHVLPPDLGNVPYSAPPRPGRHPLDHAPRP